LFNKQSHFRGFCQSSKYIKDLRIKAENYNGGGDPTKQTMPQHAASVFDLT
jgi:hypothetical protein